MIQIDWPTGVITVDQSDTDILTPLGGDVYRFDTEAFRLELKDREDDVDGIVWPRTHRHNTTVTISGVQYVRTIEILNGYTVTFTPNTSWRVSMDGSSNNNFHDVGILNMNSVQVIPQNSAGNTVTETGVSGLTVTESEDLRVTRQWLTNAQHVTEGVSGNFQMWDDGADPEVDPPLYTQDVTDKDGNPIVLPSGAPAKRSEAV